MPMNFLPPTEPLSGYLKKYSRLKNIKNHFNFIETDVFR